MPHIPVSDDVLVHTLRKGEGDYEYLIFKVPDNAENRYVTTPSTLFSIAGITKSNLKSFKEHVTCFKYFYSTIHQTHSVASGGFKGSGRNQMTDLTVLVANDSYRGDLLNRLSNGQPVPEIVITSIMWIGDKEAKIKAEEHFKDARVVGHTESRYYSLFTFRCEKLEVKINKVKQDTAELEAGSAAGFDYVKNTRI
jgi:hypothetical protein